MLHNPPHHPLHEAYSDLHYLTMASRMRHWPTIPWWVQSGIFGYNGNIQLGSGATEIDVTPGVDRKANLGNSTFRFEQGHIAEQLRLYGAGGASLAALVLDQQTDVTSPTDGALYHDSARNQFQAFVSGIKGTIGTTLFSQTADAATTAGGTTSELTLFGTGYGTKILPANFFAGGATIEFEAQGYLKHTAAAPTLTIKFKFGSTVVLTTNTNATALLAPSSSFWRCRGTLTCRTTGATGTVHGQGVFELIDTTTGLGTPTWWQMIRTSALVTDTTAAITCDLTHQWGTSHADNIMTCTNLVMRLAG